MRRDFLYLTEIKVMRRLLFLLVFISFIARAQSPWPSESWSSATNLTEVMSSSGVTDLSGLHWNSLLKRLYAVQGDGRLHVLQLNTATNVFTQIADKALANGPEGITQADLSANTFYTIDENQYEIRKFNHNNSFSSISLSRHWNLLAAPSPMQDTGNLGPEGIVFVPDAALSAAGFISQQTGQPYVSQKGMGGLMFVAHQDGGYLWVFDINPNVNNDFSYVGKYKTNQTESCDLAFDQSSGMLYILHNVTANNTIELSNLSTISLPNGERKMVTTAEYHIPDSGANANIEGFAITPKCDPLGVSVWLCRDVESSESLTAQQDVLRWFSPFEDISSCLLGVHDSNVTKISIAPNPVGERLTISGNSLDGADAIIYNSVGQIVFHGRLSGPQPEINTQYLTSGIYFVKVKSNNSEWCAKFVKR
ncbi:MAG: T9SS type A sorting domain-containing protein [Flavobacterium sp.]|nr:MAG: T9SS type A sorting domain-containing protein [Flavobacterium sp.]